MGEFWNKINKIFYLLVKEEKIGEREIGKEGNFRRFFVVCEMRKDRKVCGREFRDRNLSRFFSYFLRGNNINW